MSPRQMIERQCARTRDFWTIKKKITGCFFICTILAFPAFCEKDDLSIHVSLWDKVITTTEPFDIKVIIQNKSANDESMGIWACSKWRTDNSSIKVKDKICVIGGVACKTLKPAEKDEKLVTLYVADHEKTGEFMFRLGFDACFCVDASQSRCTEENTYWSNPIKIQVQ